MNASSTLRFGLDDLLADLRHARRQGDLGRMALLVYCDVRRWARQAGETALAEHSAVMITEVPHASRDVFLAQVDSLFLELEQVQSRWAQPAPAVTPPLAPAPLARQTKYA